MDGNDTILPAHTEGHARGQHNGKGTYNVVGAGAEGWQLRGSLNGLRIATQSGHGWPMGAANERGHSLHDPVTITLREIDTGAAYTEQLMSLDISSGSDIDSATAWEYDSTTGVSLSAEGPGGFASISGVAVSPWLVSPIGNFGASLAEGLFTATGAWASLPWTLTFNGADVVQATLAPEYVPTNFDYIIPDGLLVDGYMYEQDLGVHDEVAGLDIIPEPATLSLLALGGLMLARRRRQTW